MSNYDITGWSGGRRPITNNLKAGQFRQMGVPRNASSNIFINNNLGCLGSYNGAYFDDCCYRNDTDSSMSKFEKWMIGLGVGGGLMGCILGLFGRGKSEGAGDTSEAQPKTDEFAGLKELYKTDKYTFAKIGDKYICKMGDDEVEGDSIEALHDQIKAKRQEAQQSTTTTPTTPTQQTGQTGQTGQTEETTDEFLDNYKDSGNSPVEVQGTDLADLFKKVRGVYDDGKDSKGRDIGDFKTATAKNYNAQKGTVTIGDHEYKVISDKSNGYLYVEDTSPRGGSENNRQVYIVEYNSGTQKYELHQRPFDENCIGVNKGAH